MGLLGGNVVDLLPSGLVSSLSLDLEGRFGARRFVPPGHLGLPPVRDHGLDASRPLGFGRRRFYRGPALLVLFTIVVVDQRLRIQTEDLRAGADIELPERSAGQGMELVLLQGLQVAELNPRRDPDLLDRPVLGFTFALEPLAEAGHQPYHATERRLRGARGAISRATRIRR